MCDVNQCKVQKNSLLFFFFFFGIMEKIEGRYMVDTCKQVSTTGCNLRRTFVIKGRIDCYVKN